MDGLAIEWMRHLNSNTRELRRKLSLYHFRDAIELKAIIMRFRSVVTGTSPSVVSNTGARFAISDCVTAIESSIESAE